MGMLYLFEIITIPLGLVWIARHWHLPSARFLLFWLLISPISSALTKDGGNHAGRLIVMLPPLILVSALGLGSLLHRRIVTLGVLLSGLFFFSFFMYRYHVEWPADSWRFWQFGFKEGLTYIKDDPRYTGRVFINSTYETALPRFLFWFEYDPESFQTQSKSLIYTQDIVPGFSGYVLDNKYYFGTIANNILSGGFKALLQPGDVYLASFRDEIGTSDWTTSPTEGISVDKIVYSPTGEKIFAVLSVSP